MKKILYILLTVFVSFSCQDFNENNFDWYEEAERPTNVASYEYTMTDADYTIIVNALKATGVEENIALANKLNTAKKFSPELDPATLIPYLLEKKYIAVDVKSSAKITYKYDAARDEVLSGLTGAGHILNNEDYKLAWGDMYATSLNPQKTPDAKLPLILAANYTSPEEGDYVTLEYNYSADNSVTSVVESTPVYLSENFESYATNATALTGWINKDVTGTKSWQVKYFATENNKYMQMSSNNSAEKNTVWLVTPKVNLETAVTPYLTFFVTAGYYNADCLSIKISTDFDGTEGGLATATWADITNKFTLPKAPASGYGTLSTAGMGDLNAYKGKNVYIAFKYEGDATSTPVKTTTFQIDNVKVCEATVGIDVPNKVPQFAAYTYSGGAWKKVGSNTIVLQPADYAKLEITSNTMTAAQAKDLLPQYLRNVVGTEGAEKNIVYRTKAGEFYADKYTFTGGTWVLNTTLSEETSQYVFAQLPNKKAWIFDPTIIIPISKADYRLIVDYVKEHHYVGNENVWDTRGNAEYYYGFSEYYGNISYREVGYRDKDNTYPISGTQDEKIKFMNDRTKEGLAIMLGIKFPNATPTVNGVDQLARFDNIIIYSEPNAATNVTWSYTFQCVGDKQWVFVSRESNDGRSESAPK